jgi:cytochrome oxidase assembly protein ShyY1
MDHLTYIMASYAIAVVMAAAYAIAAWARMGRARKRLAAIDPRGRDRA